MYNLLVITDTDSPSNSLVGDISRTGLTFRLGEESVLYEIDDSVPFPDIVLFDLNHLTDNHVSSLIDQCHNLTLPSLGILQKDDVSDFDPALNLDEFILKPFSKDELIARIKQAIFRLKGPAGAQILKFGQLFIDLEKYEVINNGRRVSLTYKEFQLLVLLASSPGRVYSREVLLSQVWGYEYLGGTRTVDVHVRRLRSKIEDPDHPFIETIWNVGYRFNTEVSDFN